MENYDALTIQPEGRKISKRSETNGRPTELTQSEISHKDKTRFWSKVKKDTQEKCWEWTGTKREGYGQFWIKNRSLVASRVAFVISNGDIQKGIIVMHKCDNPKCVNPDHLKTGTPKDNSQDMVNKKRSLFTVHPEKCPRGEKHHLFGKIVNQFPGEMNPAAKLDSFRVLEIRKLYGDGGISQKSLGKMFGITQPMVGNIVRGDAWRHI